MMMLATRLAFVLLGTITLLARAAPTKPSGCAPLTVQSNFNLTEYLRASWYVQKQQKNGSPSLTLIFTLTG